MLPKRTAESEREWLREIIRRQIVAVWIRVPCRKIPTYCDLISFTAITFDVFLSLQATYSRDHPHTNVFWVHGTVDLYANADVSLFTSPRYGISNQIQSSSCITEDLARALQEIKQLPWKKSKTKSAVLWLRGENEGSYLPIATVIISYLLSWHAVGNS